MFGDRDTIIRWNRERMGERQDSPAGHALSGVEPKRVPFTRLSADDRGRLTSRGGRQRRDLPEDEPERHAVLPDGPAEADAEPRSHCRDETTVPVAMIRSNRSTGSTKTLTPPSDTFATPLAVSSS